MFTVLSFFTNFHKLFLYNIVKDAVYSNCSFFEMVISDMEKGFKYTNM